MPLVIARPAQPPQTNDPILQWLIATLKSIAESLIGLITLDADVRAQRTQAAERGVFFTGVSSATLISFETLIPETIVKDFTTALIMFDSTSGAGRFRYDGGIPAAAALATSGMPIPASGYQLVITGALNIRSFKVIGEAGATLNLSVTLHQ